MDQTSSIDMLITNRASMYLFLARCFRIEVDQIFLDQLAQMDFGIESDQPEIAEGYRMLMDYLAQVSSGTLTDLAVDYASVFLAAGKLEGHSAFPYESVYTSPDKLIMQDARDQVLKLYRDEGLDRSDELDVPEDHIALELEFMAYLCQKTHDALMADQVEIAVEYLTKQKHFLEQHLLNWIPAFSADTQQSAHTDFYRAVAKVLGGYLEMEQTLIGQLLEEFALPVA